MFMPKGKKSNGDVFVCPIVSHCVLFGMRWEAGQVKGDGDAEGVSYDLLQSSGSGV